GHGATQIQRNSGDRGHGGRLGGDALVGRTRNRPYPRHSLGRRRRGADDGGGWRYPWSPFRRDTAMIRLRLSYLKLPPKPPQVLGVFLTPRLRRLVKFPYQRNQFQAGLARTAGERVVRSPASPRRFKSPTVRGCLGA